VCIRAICHHLNAIVSIETDDFSPAGFTGRYQNVTVDLAAPHQTLRPILRPAAIVALARKLLVALWHYVNAGIVIEGAVARA
jgi:hypothetical protein